VTDKPLTEPQKRALMALSKHPYLSPAMLGQYMLPKGHRHLKAQGYGRLGGSMAWRLRRMGLARSVDRAFGSDARRWSLGFAITELGRKRLAEES